MTKIEYSYALVVSITDVAAKGLNVPERYTPKYLQCAVADLLADGYWPDESFGFDTPLIYGEFPYVRLNKDVTAVQAVLLAQKIKKLDGVKKVEVLRTSSEGIV